MTQDMRGDTLALEGRTPCARSSGVLGEQVLDDVPVSVLVIECVPRDRVRPSQRDAPQRDVKPRVSATHR